MSEEEKSKFSFQRGWNKIPVGKVPEVRRRLMAVMGVNTRVGFCQRRKGAVEPKVSEAKAIEQVFAEIGIKDIWGAE